MDGYQPFDFHGDAPIRTYPTYMAPKPGPGFARYRRWIFAKGFIAGVAMTVMCALASWPVVVWWNS